MLIVKIKKYYLNNMPNTKNLTYWLLYIQSYIGYYYTYGRMQLLCDIDTGSPLLLLRLALFRVIST